MQRVTEHILDEEKKRKVNVSFKFNIYSTFFLLIYKIWELWEKMLPTNDGEQRSTQCSHFWVTELASLLYILAAAKSGKGPEAVCAQLCCSYTQGRPGPALCAGRSATQNRGAADQGRPCECCVHDRGVPSVLTKNGKKAAVSPWCSLMVFISWWTFFELWVEATFRWHECLIRGVVTSEFLRTVVGTSGPLHAGTRGAVAPPWTRGL